MKKYIMAILIALTATTQAQWNHSYDAWENYDSQYGNYFDRFFNKPRIMYYAPDRLAHASTVRMMADYGIPYRNQYTGKYNGVQTAAHIWNTSRTAEEYTARLRAWASR